MTEHELISPNMDNVKQASPTLFQQKELLSIARIGYLREHNIPIANEEVLRRTMGVLKDALTRHLQEEGRGEIKPNERLRPLINKGLLLRDSLHEEAKNVLDLTSKNETTGLGNVGPFALQNSLLIKAHNESKNYLLTPDLKYTEQLVDTSRRRKIAIDKFAAVGIANLPEELGGVTLDRIPDIVDRSKLIRNMIASFLFRGNLNPIIEMTELRNFQTLNKSAYFADEAKGKIINAFNLSDKEEITFVLDLFNQTKEAFCSNQSVPKGDDDRGMDGLFRNFSKDLLLLHPILEEEQIITYPGAIVRGVPNLWNDAETIAGFKIPNREMLLRAIRQARTKNEIFNEDRLYKGLRVWRQYDKMVLKHMNKAKRIKNRLKERESLLENILSDSAHPLPNEAYGSKYSSEKQIHDKWSTAAKSESEARRLTKVIRNNSRIQKETREYEEWLRITYGDNFPDFVPMSRSVFLQKLKNEVRSIRAAKNFKNTTLTVIEEALNTDSLFPGEANHAYINLGNMGAQKWIKQELIRSKGFAEEFKKKPENIPCENQDDVIFPNEYALRNLKEYLVNKALPGKLRSYLKFWIVDSKNLKEYLNSKPETWKIAYREFVLEATRRRVDLLEYSVNVMESYSSLTNDLENAEARLNKWLKETGEPLPTNAIWSKEEASKYILETKASELPAAQEMSSDDLQKAVPKMLNFIVSVSPSTFPLVVSSRSELKTWINQEIVEIKKEMKKKMEEKTFKSKMKSRETSIENKGRRELENREIDVQVMKINEGIRSLSRKLKFSSKAIGLANGPFAPFLENTSFNRDDFLRICRKRLILANAILSEKKRQEESNLAKIEFETLLRSTYARKVKQEITSMQKDLGVLEKEDLRNWLIGRMADLSLALQDSDQKEEKSPSQG